MTVVSVSIDDKLLEDVDKLEQEQGFTGRSELIRTALRNLIEQTRKTEQMGNVSDAILLVKYTDGNAEAVSDILHDYRGIIQSQLHNHLENHACIEILVLNGDGDDIKSLWQAMQTSKDVLFTDIITP